MAKIGQKCFICDQVSPPEAQTDPNLSSSCGSRLDAKNLFVLFQRRALDFIDLCAVLSELVDQICFCRSCLDELELTKNMVDAFDKLMKIVELHKIKIQLKFLESKLLGGNWKDTMDLPKLESRSQGVSVAVLDADSRSTSTIEPSKSPGFFSPVTTTKTKLNHFRKQTTTPSASQTILQLPDFGIGRSSSVSSEIQNAQLLDTNGQDGIQNISSDSWSEATRCNDLSSEQRTTADASGNKKAKASSDPCHAIQQISPGKKKPSNKPESEPRMNERKHKCQMCPARFKAKQRLTDDLRIHTGPKPFSCKHCPKTFAANSNLRRHERIHSGEKSFSCKFCSKTFSTSWDLRVHERVHTGEKPYLCRICSKKFLQSGHLVIHMRSHTGEKPFKCAICFKEFADSSTLNRHKKTHDPSDSD